MMATRGGCNGTLWQFDSSGSLCDHGIPHMRFRVDLVQRPLYRGAAARITQLEPPTPRIEAGSV